MDEEEDHPVLVLLKQPLSQEVEQGVAIGRQSHRLQFFYLIYVQQFSIRCPDSKKQCKWKTTRTLVSLNHDHQYWEYVTQCVCLHIILENVFLTSKYCYNICLLKQKKYLFRCNLSDYLWKCQLRYTSRIFGNNHQPPHFVKHCHRPNIIRSNLSNKYEIK